jgi:hypothetical protein
MASYQSLKYIEKKLRTKSPREVLSLCIPKKEDINFTGNVDDIDYVALERYLSQDQIEIVKYLVNIIKSENEV